MTENLPTETNSQPMNPWRCLSGAGISAAIGTGAYFMTISIAQTFAGKPVTSDNPFVVNITVAVRTLVVGISTLATAIFGIVALGLLALAVQLFFQSASRPEQPPS